MDEEVLPWLRCPTCSGALDLRDSRCEAHGEIVAGGLHCGCGAVYPIRDGIADFLGRPRPPTIAQLTNELPATAWAYERLWRPFALTLLSGELFPYERELALVTEWVDAARGGLFVDVACSNGLYARALARAIRYAPGHVIGVDHALPMLREARQRARAARVRVSYLRASAQALPVASGAASGVTIGGSLNEIGDLDACLREVRRILTDDGRFVAMTLLTAQGAVGRAVQFAVSAGGIVFWSREELLQRFRAAGLYPQRDEQHGIVLFTLAFPSPQSERVPPKDGRRGTE
ncbi:MAG: methyltransferase domain-containing protein [Roseiflexaceae bacterium]|nr:methyltransferase domain-containing protein [Roseiflexaceae bacterium]